jgi:ribose transport system ATP-binding protein
VGAKREVQGLIDELAEQGLAVVLVSSEMDELVEGSDRIVVLHYGAVSGELSGDQLTSAQLLTALAGGTPSDTGTAGTSDTGTAAGAGRSDRG